MSMIKQYTQNEAIIDIIRKKRHLVTARIETRNKLIGQTEQEKRCWQNFKFLKSTEEVIVD